MRNPPLTQTTWRPVLEGSKSAISGRSLHSQDSHTPSPRPQRENISSQIVTPEGRQKSGEGVNRSSERRSALERISQLIERVPLLQDGIANSASGRLQEVQIQYIEENPNLHASRGSNIPSSSKTPRAGTLTGQGGITDRSPIRTLSKDRVHDSSRLGPVYTPNSAPREAGNYALLADDLPQLARATEKAKGKASLPPESRKRVTRSSSQKSVAVKKRRVTKVHNSPKRRTPPATPATGQAGRNQGTSTGAQPSTTVYPSARRKGTDFRSDPNPLP